MANLLTTFSAVCAVAPSLCPQQHLPIVDLGYERHQAIEYNQAGGFYNFSNIRYAEPPVGNLRFMAPKKPTGKSSKIDNGSVGKICPQSEGSWELAVKTFVEDYLFHQHFNYSKVTSSIPKKPPPGTDPRETEDCLFLDVHAPSSVFNSGKASAPVLVWIYGGGYTTGDKSEDGYYDPTGLLEASSEPFVTVAMNYRLGAMGWLGGPDFQGEGGTPNAALWDQRLALEWVQDNIHLFGGDKKRVTVMGESAGAGSLMHQITAFGGSKGPVPFQQAIPQSTAFLPVVSKGQQNAIWHKLLKQLGASNLKEAQKMSTKEVIRANQITSWNSLWGNAGYGPLVDGDFVPKLPGQLLAEGKYDKSLKVMTSHVTLEGLAFVSPQIKTAAKYTDYVKLNFPSVTKSQLKYLETKLYPSSQYKTQFDRAVATTQDVAFDCNSQYMNTAWNSKTYAYQFAEAPAVHGADVPYTWWHGSSTVDVPVAKILQGYVTSFLVNGKPVSKGNPDLPLYSDGEKEVIIRSKSAVKVVPDNTNNKRCTYWQKGTFA